MIINLFIVQHYIFSFLPLKQKVYIEIVQKCITPYSMPKQRVFKMSKFQTSALNNS